MVHVSAVFLVVSAATVATAFNDWNTPCFNGACQYSLPSSSGNSPSGTLKIWGSVNAISDITGAAGWEILGCSPDAEAQDIRLVCKSDSSHDCAHLYQNTGAVGKIVRLPENCGKSAFARVAKAWTPTDQSIPSSIASRVVRRDGTQPTVRALQLDTSWHEIDASKAGNVNIAIQGANFPGVSPNISTADIATRSSRVFDRGLFDFVGKAVKAIKKLDSFDVDKNKDLKPLDVDKKFNLVDKSISCPPISASVKVDVDAKAHAVASIGIAAHGTIIPPKIKDFAITASITADLDGSLDLVADVTGTLDSGKIKIFETAIAGLDFPGILSIGPTFQVNAQATASLDAQVNLNIGLNYHIDKAALTFPPKKGSGGGAFQIGDTPLKLSVSPSVKATGSVSAHLIPTLNIGISALGKVVSANVFLNLDASATLLLSLEAQADASLTLSKGVKGRALTPYAYAAQPAPVPEYYTPPVYAVAAVVPSKSSSLVHSSSIVTKPTSAVQAVSSAKGSHSDIKATSTAKSASTARATSTSITKATTSVAKTSSLSVARSSSTSTSVKASSTPITKASNTSVAKVSSSTSVKGSATTTSSAALATNTGKTGIVATKSASESFGGCFEIKAALNVNAGADASFFGLFDKNTKTTLFSKNFEILKKCFGNKASKRSLPWIGGSRIERAALEKRVFGLTCPKKDVGAAVSVANESVKGTTIQ